MQQVSAGARLPATHQHACAVAAAQQLTAHVLCLLSLLQVLLGYRLKWPQRTTKSLMTFALGYYIITRLLQTAMVLYMIIVWAGYPAVRTTPAFIVVATLFGAFSVIQAYTLVIYHAIGRKLGDSKKGDQLADDETAAEEA